MLKEWPEAFIVAMNVMLVIPDEQATGHVSKEKYIIEVAMKEQQNNKGNHPAPKQSFIHNSMMKCLEFLI